MYNGVICACCGHFWSVVESCLLKCGCGVVASSIYCFAESIDIFNETQENIVSFEVHIICTDMKFAMEKSLMY